MERQRGQISTVNPSPTLSSRNDRKAITTSRPTHQVLQIHGSKRWTLVSPENSHLLRPQVFAEGSPWTWVMKILIRFHPTEEHTFLQKGTQTKIKVGFLIQFDVCTSQTWRSNWSSTKKWLRESTVILSNWDQVFGKKLCWYNQWLRCSGDALFLPTWTWHRVDYIPRVTALSISFFHVRPKVSKK